MIARAPWPLLAGYAAIAALVLLASPFALYALRFGLEGFGIGALRETRLFDAARPAATYGLFAHMALGAVITVLAPLQLIGGIRRRAPRLHRAIGRVVVASAIATALGGLAFIALRGAIGGPWMSAGFATAGALMLLFAGQTARFARARDFGTHRRWALRLLVMCLSSWLYRVHYGLWVLTVGRDVGMRADFTGAFDLFNVWGFYLPYLVALELLFLWERRGARVAGAT